jgi:hypothetical protein
MTLYPSQFSSTLLYLSFKGIPLNTARLDDNACSINMTPQSTSMNPASSSENCKLLFDHFGINVDFKSKHAKNLIRVMKLILLR